MRLASFQTRPASCGQLSPHSGRSTAHRACSRLRPLHRQPTQHRRRSSASAYTENPQNVDNPLVLPSPDASAEQVVRTQLEALTRNDEPWQNHGIKTAYAYGFDIGGLDPSMYFGFPKDLYHEDHFQGLFATRLPELVNNRGFDIRGVREQPATEGGPATSIVTVQVQAGTQQQQATAEFEFHLRRKQVGARKGCLMTWMLVRPSQA